LTPLFYRVNIYSTANIGIVANIQHIIQLDKKNIDSMMQNPI
jgi:hypothetical protein